MFPLAVLNEIDRIAEDIATILVSVEDPGAILVRLRIRIILKAREFNELAEGCLQEGCLPDEDGSLPNEDGSLPDKERNVLTGEKDN